MLKARALDHLPGGRAQFDPLTILVLEAIVSAVVAWLVERCLNHLAPEAIRQPNLVQRLRLRRAVRRACREIQASPTALAFREPNKDFDRDYGNDIHSALLQTGTTLQDHELVELRNPPC